MTPAVKTMLGVVMALSLLFGFFDSIWPEASLSFKRLHIFGFNLLTGGSLIVYYTDCRGVCTPRVKAYFAIALLYAISGAAGWYPLTLALSLPLFLLVESVRIQRFSLFPVDFFRPAPVSDKFSQAALLCLSIGILVASLVILNNEYFGLISYEKLSLDVFFLGYSFPVSLITMSIMFSFMTEASGRLVRAMKEFCFWSVNVGVIVFFLFIILDLTYLEIAVATGLFLTVWMIFFLFIATAPSVQQKTFLISGMVFLLFTALTGIVYILQYFYPALEPHREYLLMLHTMISLYGWNLTGLFIIIRWSDFPIRLNSGLAITLHWAIVLVLAPLGKHLLPVSGLAMTAYVALLLVVIAGRTAQEEAIP